MHWDKLLTIFLFGLFLVSFASAFEFDNKEYYDEEKDTYTIRDSILGIPTTKVSEITRTGLTKIGATKVYLDFNYNLYEDNYVDPFKYIRLDLLINNELIDGEQVPFEILVKEGTKLEDKDTYTKSCEVDVKNESNTICITTKSGIEKIVVDNYISLDQTKLRSGNYQIRLVLEKGIYDEVDWILNLNGRELIEWDFLGNSLQGYWTFDSADVDAAFNVDNNSINNFTQFVGTPIKVAESKLGAFAMKFTSGNTLGNTTINATEVNTFGEFSWSFWINHTGSGAEQKVMAHKDVGFGNRFIQLDSQTLRFSLGDGSSNKNVLAFVGADEYHFVVVTADEGDAIRIYVDNVLEATTGFGGSFTNNGLPFTIGSTTALSNFYSGILDEIGYWDVELTSGDVNSMWNNGDGLAFPNPVFPSPIVTLNSPADALEQINKAVTFNCSATNTPNNIINVSLYLDGVINYTESGNDTTIELLQTIGEIGNGGHNWTCTTRDEQNQFGETTNRTFTISDFAVSSQTYNASTYPTALEAFIINVSFNSSEFPVSTATLNYNNTIYLGTTVDTGDDKSYTTSLIVPELDIAKNINFYWSFILTNSTGNNYFNSSTNNQSVDIINASILGSPYTNAFINFTTYDQDNLTKITSSIASTLEYGISSITETLSYSDSSGSKFSFEYAFEPPHLDYLVKGDLEFTKSNYVTNNYVLLQQSISNITTNQSIYLLNSSRSTSFIVQVKDSSFDGVAGAVIESQRYYPSTNEWITIESFETNIEGKTIGHFVIEDVNYRFKVYVNTILVLTSTPTLVFCELTPCTITLKLPSTSEDPYANTNPLSEYSSNLIYDSSTETFTFTYTDTDTATQGGRLRVVRTDFGIASNVEICNEANPSGTAVIICDISSEINGTYIASGYSNRTSDESKLTERIGIAKIRNIIGEIGGDGLIWSAFFFIAITLLFLFSPSMAIISSMFSIIAIKLMGLVDISLISIIALLFTGAIILGVINK